MTLVPWLLSAMALLILLLTLAGEHWYMRALYGKPVLTDSAAAAVRAAEEKLKAAGIRYTLTTIKRRPGFAQGADVTAHARYNLPYRSETAQQRYVYEIYVPRKRRADAERALQG